MINKMSYIHRTNEAYSSLRQLEMIIENNEIWGLVEELEAFHQSRGSSGPRRQYTLMDILVTSVAAQLYLSDRPQYSSSVTARPGGGCGMPRRRRSRTIRLGACRRARPAASSCTEPVRATSAATLLRCSSAV